MQTYLAVTPDALQEASRFCRSMAHVAYRIGPGSVLLRQNLLLKTKPSTLLQTEISEGFAFRVLPKIPVENFCRFV